MPLCYCVGPQQVNIYPIKNCHGTYGTSETMETAYIATTKTKIVFWEWLWLLLMYKIYQVYLIRSIKLYCCQVDGKVQSTNNNIFYHLYFNKFVITVSCQCVLSSPAWCSDQVLVFSAQISWTRYYGQYYLNTYYCNNGCKNNIQCQ